MIDLLPGKTSYLGTDLYPRVVAFTPLADGTVEIVVSTFTWNYGEQTHRSTTDVATARRHYREYVREGYVPQRTKWSNSRKGR